MDDSLFSIYIQKDEHRAPIPSSLELNIDSFKEHCRAISPRHYLLGDQDIRSLLREKLDRDLLVAYEAVRPHAYKSDIARYALMYVYGGVYADLSMRFVNPLASLATGEKGCLCNGIRKNNLYNGLLYSRKGEVFFLRALEQVARRVHDEYYGPNPVSITGPRLLHDTLQLHPGLGEGFRFYDVKALTPDREHINMAILDHDGTIICLRNKRKVGGLEELGLPGSDYRQMWEERSVYIGK